MSFYPSQVFSTPTYTDEVDVVAAAIVNTGNNEIIALQQYIGTTPQGTRTCLTDRINVCLNGSGAIFNSNGFPGSPITGQILVKTDENVFYFYSSGQWNSSTNLSNTVFSTLGVTFATNATTYNTYSTFRYKKLQGVNTLTIYAYMKQSSGGQSTDLRVTVGALAGSVVTSSSETSFTEHSLTYNVSGLVNGSYYTVVLEIESSSTGSTGSVKDIIAFAS